MTDELPNVTNMDGVRDPECSDWDPMSGPFWWERHLQTNQVAWMDQNGSHEGLGIRDVESPGTEYVCSTVYVPNIRGIL